MARKKRVPTPEIPLSTAGMTTPEALLERFKDFPAINVIARRFSNPNDPGSLPILLKDESPDVCTNSEHQNRIRTSQTVCTMCRPSRPVRKWFVYWVNTAREGRWANMKEKGYVPVDISELQDVEDVSDRVKNPGDSYVRRGDTGKEVLMKMPLEVSLYIKRQQQEIRTARFGSKKQVQSDLSELAGREFGDEAGQTIHDGGIQIESMRRVRSTLGDEANDAIDA